MNSMFTGLSVFPLTPMNEDQIDESSFIRLIDRLVDSKVDSIGALGSTGNYAYLKREERARVAKLTVEHAADVPVIVGIGALRVKDILLLAEDAQHAGARAVLLAPVSYQELSNREVFELYKTVNAALSVPLCVYDNPRTTHFTFNDELLGEIAQLSNVRSIKIPAVPLDFESAKKRIERLRALIPTNVSIGVSGDASAAIGLSAGCDVWYSVIGGLFPKTALAITRAAQTGNKEKAAQLTGQLNGLWALVNECGGSLRVIATAAELLGLAESPSLPLPLKTLSGGNRDQLKRLLEELKLN